MKNKDLLFDIELPEKPKKKTGTISDKTWEKLNYSENFLYVLCQFETEKVFIFERRRRKGKWYCKLSSKCYRLNHHKIHVLDTVSNKDIELLDDYFEDNGYRVWTTTKDYRTDLFIGELKHGKGD